MCGKRIQHDTTNTKGYSNAITYPALASGQPKKQQASVGFSHMCNCPLYIQHPAIRQKLRFNPWPDQVSRYERQR